MFGEINLETLKQNSEPTLEVLKDIANSLPQYTERLMLYNKSLDLQEPTKVVFEKARE